MTIHKTRLELTTRQQINLPVDAKILTAQLQDGEITIWYQFEEERFLPVTLFVIGTGHEVPRDAQRYIATIQLPSGLVLHIYEDRS